MKLHKALVHGPEPKAVEHFEAIRYIALRDVLLDTPECMMESVCLWYAKNCCTPLHVVHALPFENVLLTFYRAHYRDMEEEDQKVELSRLLETAAERKARKSEELAVKEDADAFAAQIAAKEGTKGEEKPKLDAASEPEINKLPAPNIDIGTLKELPPEISMTFESPDDFESRLERIETTKML